MKQINPLHLLVLLATVLMTLLFTLNSLKEDLSDAKKELVKRSEIADDLLSLKKSWGSKKQTKVKLLKILNSAALKRAGVEYSVLTSKIVIDAENMKSKEFTYLLNKVFNTPLNIKSFKIRRLDAYHASLHMEVSL